MRRGRGHNSVPVSLFAFQDVMTSIMGILLMVTLLMALDQSRSGRGTPAAVPTTESMESLLAQKEHLAQVMRDLRAKAGASTNSPFSRLLSKRLELERLYSKIEAMNSQVARSYAVVASEVDANSDVAGLLRDLNLAAQEVERLKGEIQNVRERRRMTYIISKQFPKKPIIVEIAEKEWNISFEPESNNSFALVATDVNRALALLRSQIEDFPPDQYFVVLVVKPSGMASYKNVDEMLEDRGYDRGLEPLPEDWTTTAPSTDIPGTEDER